MIRVILQLAHPDADILIVFSQHRLAVRIGIDPRCDHALWRIIAGCHIFRRIAVGIQRGLLHDGKPVPPVRTGVTVCVFQFLRTPGRQFQQYRRHFQRRKPVFLPELVGQPGSLFRKCRRVYGLRLHLPRFPRQPQKYPGQQHCAAKKSTSSFAHLPNLLF